jgi:hypothetical protein
VSDRDLVAGGLSGVDSALEVLAFDQTGAHAVEICIAVVLSNDHDETPNVEFSGGRRPSDGTSS